MAVSRDTGHRQQPSFWKRLFGQLTRYDAVLTVIPLLFVVASVVSVAFTVPFHVAVASGAILSASLIADALYLNPPVAETE